MGFMLNSSVKSHTQNTELPTKFEEKLPSDTSKSNEIIVLGSTAIQKEVDLNKVFSEVDIAPQPLIGVNKFRNWVLESYRMPWQAIEAETQAKLTLSFIVNRDGKLSDFKLLNNLGFGTGEEFIRVMKTSQLWIPGIKDGNTVRTLCEFSMFVGLK